MRGMNRHTGRSIAGAQHLYQSVATILSTPTGSRLQRRLFGSILHQLVDAPNNPATRVRLYAAVATALMVWEPRLKLTRIGLSMSPDTPGAQVLDIFGITSISRDEISFSVQVAGRSA